MRQRALERAKTLLNKFQALLQRVDTLLQAFGERVDTIRKIAHRS
jgi:hypothetical protein